MNPNSATPIISVTPLSFKPMAAPKGKDYGQNIYDARGSFVATIPNDSTQNGERKAGALAALIVTSVNSYEALAADNARLRALLESAAPALGAQAGKESARGHLATASYLSGLAARCRSALSAQ